MDKCIDCRFYKPLRNSEDQGECRAEPPLAEFETNEAVWPIVQEDDSCGNFEEM